jgi:carbamoyl-phosphate synthase large subunit
MEWSLRAAARGVNRAQGGPTGAAGRPVPRYRHAQRRLAPMIRVLVAGIGGASLGTELSKCLRDAGGYEVFGCDVSEFAYGHYDPALERTFLVDRDGYLEGICELCRAHGIRAVIPGGEEPLGLLAPAAATFQTLGVHVATNTPEVVAICSDKGQLCARLAELGVPVPATAWARDPRTLPAIPFPWVVKPARGGGGSHLVALAGNLDEARAAVGAITANGLLAVVQEYLPLDEGEFSFGIVSSPTGRILGSIAMRRLFPSKLSVTLKTKVGLISSPYGQGLIAPFPELQAQAEEIARRLDSRGPLNIQGRVVGGTLRAFEVNPRFSGSTYLRALAGFNEVDTYLRSALRGQDRSPAPVRTGYYLRSLSEVYVPVESVKRR